MTKITIDREIAERALAALKKNHYTMIQLGPPNQSIINEAFTAFTALRQALEQPNEFNPDWDQIKPFNDRIAELEKVAKQALEAIEEFVSNKLTFGQRYTNEGQCLLDSITALRQALEQPRPAPPELEAAVNDALGLTAQLEPVAWMYTSHWKGDEIFITRYQSELTKYKADKVWPLYTHPLVIDKSAAIRIATALGWEPKREWVGLTDEDIVRIASTPCAVVGSYVHTFARAAEAKLKEKNT